MNKNKQSPDFSNYITESYDQLFSALKGVAVVGITKKIEVKTAEMLHNKLSNLVHTLSEFPVNMHKVVNRIIESNKKQACAMNCLTGALVFVGLLQVVVLIFK